MSPLLAFESVEPIYLDPPFNPNATDNVLCWGNSGRDRMPGRTAVYSQKATFIQSIDGIIPRMIDGLRASPVLAYAEEIHGEVEMAREALLDNDKNWSNGLLGNNRQ